MGNGSILRKPLLTALLLPSGRNGMT